MTSAVEQSTVNVRRKIDKSGIKRILEFRILIIVTFSTIFR